MTDETPGTPSYGPPQPYAPQYGAPQPYPYAGYPYAYAAPAPRTNVLAIISFVAAFVMSVAAVVCGHIALSQIKRTGEGGRGLAIAGLVLGYAGIGFFALFFVIWLVMFIAVVSNGYATGSLSS